MKIKMVCMEDGLVSHGFRRLSAFVEGINEDTDTHFVSTNVNRSIGSLLLARYGGELSDEMTNEIAEGLVDADIIGFSSMTAYATAVKAVIHRVKQISERPFVIWGGIHPIVDPDDAVASDVDAICTGEGELAFQEFLDLFGNGKDFTGVANFWFYHGGNVLRNGFRPLLTSHELNSLPCPKYGEDEKVYKRGKGFVQATLSDYLASDGLSYRTLWTIGCPFHCSYCSNTKFIENDSAYRKIRHASARHIIEEVKQV
ncbi:MAG: B12-binding domain-containing radical SAM protein, partial [Planctomycetota bacterium]